MAQNNKKLTNVVETVGLRFDDGKIDFGKTGEYQIVEQYTVQSAGVVGLFPEGYKFFSGRQFQWNKDIEQYEYFSAVIIAEFSIGKQKFYVSGENFYKAVEQAVLMKNYILNNKKKRSK